MANKLRSSAASIIRASDAPQSVGEQLRHHMKEIAGLFDKAKLTLVVRSLSLEGDLIVTNDGPDEAIAAIKKYCEQHSKQEVVPLN